MRVALSGGPDASLGLAYLHAVALRQVAAGAQFLDVNVDEYSHRLHEQIEVMTWLVGELAPMAGVPLSIDSSNLEIIRAGLEACGGQSEPPMLNSASLERIEALDLAAEIGGAVIVTAAGATGMPSDSEQRVGERQRDGRARARARHPDGAHLRRPAGLPDLGRRRVRRALPRRRSASCASASGPSCTSRAA